MATADGDEDGIRHVLILGVRHRDPFTGPIDSSASVTYHVCDLSKPLNDLFTTIKPDLVISTASGGSFDTQQRIIDAAIEAHIPRFIAPEFSQDSLSPKIQDRLPPTRERARTMDYLRKQATDGRIRFVGIATGVALDRGLLSGNLGFDLKWQSATLHGQGHEKFAACSTAWIGRVVLAVIENWEEVENQYLYAAGMVVSADEIVQTLEEATGKTFEVGRGKVEQCVREAERRLQSGWPDAGMFLMERSILYDESIDAVGPFEREDAKERLGLESESLKDLVRAVLHDEKHHNGKPGCGCD